ncbi:hypothetical protein KBC99_02955, partial [Candidatus Saccharibacteria bacterium]|nr:hypothetical protein [Candidatus Saccharibacteria bacterium]
LIEASVMEEPAHDPENEAINHMPEPDPTYDEYRKTRSKSTPVLAALLLITLIGAGVLGWLWWSGRAQVSSLNKKVSDLESSNASLDKQLKAATGSSTVTESSDSVSDTRTITELGLTYDVTDTTRLITYRYRELIDAQSKIHSVLSLSSTAVIAAERKVNTTGAPKCTAEFAPLGILTSYKTGDLYKGARVETLTADKEKTFKIGENYYIYEAAQAACSTNAEVVTAVNSGKAAVATMLRSLSN